jgi:hypothetical protein
MPKPARLFAEIFGSQPRSTIIRTFDITEMAPVMMRLTETDDAAEREALSVVAHKLDLGTSSGL